MPKSWLTKKDLLLVLKLRVLEQLCRDLARPLRNKKRTRNLLKSRFNICLIHHVCSFELFDPFIYLWNPAVVIC